MKKLSLIDIGVVAGGRNYIITEVPESLVADYTKKLCDKFYSRVIKEYSDALSLCIHSIQSPMHPVIQTVNSFLDECIDNKMNNFINSVKM